MDAFPPLEVVLAANMIIAVACMVQGSVGFGSALLSAPLLLRMDPVFVPGPIICCGLTLSVLVLIRDHESLDFHGLAPCIAGRVVGTVLGAGIVGRVSAEKYSFVFALFMGLAILISAFRPLRRVRRWHFVGAGVLSGIMGTVAGAGGPPVALVYQSHQGPTVRATLAGYFVVSTSMSLIALVIVGKFWLPELLAFVAYLPGIVGGFLVSKYARGFFDKGRTRIAILVICGLSTLMLLQKSVQGWWG